MSKTIDEKVVSLQFDNANFEKNVSTSMSTLDKLKHALRFDDATDGFKNIEDAAGKVNLVQLVSQNEKVQHSFKVLEEVAVGVYRHIGEQAAQFAEKTLYSLSGMENFTAGYQKYEQKTASVQTLLNSTGKELEDINGYLDTLMRFSDETSYGFTEMASSLAQLTSSGGDIEKLIPMITGIANATAFAGKGPAEFTRAIFNLNQSYGLGHIELKDWKSLELAGVASKDLKQTLIDTAIELGKLDKSGKVLGKDIEVTVANFSETLKNKWADTEVIETAFGKFAKYTQMADEMVNAGEVDTYSQAYAKLAETYDDIYIRAAKAAQEAKTFNEAIEATKDAVGSSWLETFEIIFGDYDTAKRTWTNLANDLYEIFAVPRQNFNDMLGRAFKSQYDQLKDIFDETGEDFGELDKAFNKYLKNHGYNVKKLIDQYGSLSAAFASGNAVLEDAQGHTAKLSDVFKTFWGDNGTYGFSGYFKELIDEDLAKIEDIWDGTIESLDDIITNPLEQIQSLYDKIWSGDFGNGADRIKAMAEANIDYATAQGFINDMAKKGHRAGYKLLAEDIADLSEEQLKNIGITGEATDKISDFAFALYFASRDVDAFADSELYAWGLTKDRAKELQKIGLNYEKLMKRLDGRSGQDLVSGTISNITQSIINLQEFFRDTWEKFFGWDFSEIILRALLRINEITEGIKNFTSSLKEGASSSKLFNTVIQALSGSLEIIGAVFRLVKEVVTQLIKGGLEVLSQLFGDLDLNIEDFTGSVTEALDKATNWLKENNTIFELVKDASDLVTGALTDITNWLGQFVDIEELTKILKELRTNLENIAKGDLKITDIFSINNKDLTTIQGIFGATGAAVTTGLEKPVASASDVIAKFMTDTVTAAGKIKTTFSDSMTKVYENLKMSEEEIQKVDQFFHDTVNTLTGIGGMYMVLKFFQTMADSFSSLVAPIRKFSDVMASFANVGNQVAKYIEAQRMNISINNIMKIAIAVAILTAAMYALAKLGKEDTGSLVIALTAMLVMTGGIYLMAKAVEALSDSAFSQEKMESAKGAVNGIAVLVVAIAAAAWLMSRALKNIDSLTHPIRSAVGLIVILGGLILAIIAFIAISKRFQIDSISIGKGAGKELAGAMLGLIAFALAIKVFASALKDLDQLELKDPTKTLEMMAAIVLAFALVAWALKGVNGTAGLTMIAFASSVWAFVKVLKRLAAELSNDEYLTGLARMVPIIAMMVVVVLATKAIPKANAAFSAMLFVSLAGSVFLMGEAIKKLASLKEDEIRRGGIVALALYSVIGIVGGIASFLAGSGGVTLRGALGTSFIIVTAAASLYIMAGAMMLLNRFTPEELYKTTKVVIALLATVGAMLWLIGNGGLFGQANAYAAIGTITRIAVLVGVIAASVAGIALMHKFNPDSVEASVNGLMRVILSLTALFFVLTFQGSFADLAKDVLAIVFILAAVGSAIALLANFTQTDKAVAVADALSDTILKISEAIFIMSTASAVAGIFGAAIDNFLWVIGGIALVMTAIAGLATWAEQSGLVTKEELTTVFDTLTFVVTKIGEVIGGFVGGAISEFNEQFADDLGLFAAGLSEFSEKIQDFLKLEIPTGFGNTLTMIGRILYTFKSNKSVIKELSEMQSGQDVANLATFFFNFGRSLNTLSIAMGSANADKLEVATKAGEMLAKLNESMSSVDPLGYGGKETLESFGGGLEEFASGLVAFSKKLWEFDHVTVRNKIDAIRDIVSLEGSMDNNGGLISLIMGDNDLANFGMRAALFGEGLSQFSTSLQSFDTSVLPIAQDAAKTLTAIEEGIVKSPTLFGYIGLNGEENHSLGDFGGRIETFAEGLKTAFAAFAELSNTAIDQEAIALLAGRGANTELGVKENNLRSGSLLEIVSQNVDNIVEVAKKFAELEKVDIGSRGNMFQASVLETLGGGLTVFSQGFANMATALGDIEELPDTETIDLIASMTERLIAMATADGAQDAGTILTSIGEGLQSMAAGLTGLFEGFGASFVGGMTAGATSGVEGESTEGGFMAMIQNQIANMFTSEELIERIRAGGLAIAQTYLMAIAQELLGQEYENARKMAAADAENIANEFRYYEGEGQPYQSIYEEIAVNYLQGLLDGITNEEKIGEILSQITALGTLMVETMRSALAVASPSKLTYGIGIYFVQGLINGISHLTEDAVESAAALADSVSSAVRTAMAASDEVLSDEYSPVITPVLDTSNISKGSSAINSMLNSRKTYNAALAIQSARAATANNQNGGAGSAYNNINVSVTIDKAGGELTDEDLQNIGKQIANEVDVRLGMKLKGGRS